MKLSISNFSQLPITVNRLNSIMVFFSKNEHWAKELENSGFIVFRKIEDVLAAEVKIIVIDATNEFSENSSLFLKNKNISVFIGEINNLNRNILLAGYLNPKKLIINQDENLHFSKILSKSLGAIHYDKLTYLPKKQALLSLFEARSGEIHTLFLLDVMLFRNINNVFGFSIGNMVLRIIVETMLYSSKEIFGELTYNLFRIDGDSFALLINKEIEEKEVRLFVSSLFTAVEKLSKEIIKIEELSINFTVGISKGVGNLIPFSEIALDKAVENQRTWTFCENNLSSTNSNSSGIHMLYKIKKSIEENLVFPYYQPIFDSKTLVPCKYEALMRIQEDDGSISSPWLFLEFAKKYRIYERLNLFMIGKIFQDVVKYKIPVSLNVSFFDINNVLSNRSILSDIRAMNIGEYITFEFTETEKLSNMDIVKKFVRSVKKEGCCIAIDDFGSGFSNFSNVLEIEADIIKIDGSLMKNIHENHKHFLMVQGIVNFSKSANIKVISEYVHNQEILDIVNDLDIEFSQGFFLGEPAEIKSFLGSLNDQPRIN